MTDNTRSKEDYQDECDQLQRELIAVVKAHPELMRSQVVGILEILKFDLIEKLTPEDL
jgi:hypothetical protein